MPKQKQKTWNNIKRTLKIAGFIFAIMMMVSLIFDMNLVAFADAASDKELTNQMGTWASILQKALWPILMVIGGLMDNSLLFGKGMEQTMLDIWVPVRNLVNILVVVVLIGIALYNVLGIGGDEGSYAIKAILPKLIIGIIAVNFSFIGVKVFLDTINVLTAAVFALPAETGAANGVYKEMERNQAAICNGMTGISKNDPADLGVAKNRAFSYASSAVTQCQAAGQTTDPTKIAKISACASGTTSSEIEQCLLTNATGENTCDSFFDINVAKTTFEENQKTAPCLDGEKLNPDSGFFKQFGAGNAALILAVDIGKMVAFENISGDTTNIKDLAISTVFSVVMYIVYVLTFLALGVVLAGRIVILWISIVLSPVILMLMAVPAVKEQSGGLKEITDQFMKNAIAPLLIAIPMSIGFIMIQGIRHNLGSGGGAFSSDLSTGSFYTGIPVAGMNTFESLLAMIGTLAVIWVGVFGAAEGTIAQSVTGAIKGFGQKVGGYILQKPLEHFPLAPIKGLEGGQNLHASDVISAISTMHAPSIFTTATAKAQSLQNALGFGTQRGSNNISELKNSANVSEAVGTLAKAKIGTATGEGLKTAQVAVADLAKNKPEMFTSMATELETKGGLQGAKQKLKDFAEGKQVTGLAEAIDKTNNSLSAAPADKKDDGKKRTKTPGSKEIADAKKTTTLDGGFKSESEYTATIGDTSNFTNESGNIKLAKGKSAKELGKTAKKGDWEAITGKFAEKLKATNSEGNFKLTDLKKVMGDGYDVAEEALGKVGIQKILDEA